MNKMNNIVLHISIYLFPWLHVLCDLRHINTDIKHAILIIFISRFIGDININFVFMEKLILFVKITVSQKKFVSKPSVKYYIGLLFL